MPATRGANPSGARTGVRIKDRAWLNARLAEGHSIEAIAREVGRHPSTVAHWVNKHGLVSSFAARHATKGTVERAVLVALVEEGLSVREIGTHIGRGSTAVRHWLGRYGLQTASTSRPPITPVSDAVIIRRCRRHGFTAFALSADGTRYRCKPCRSEHVSTRRRKVKRTLIDEAGGCCALCGYDAYAGALQFHHRDPAAKAFGLATQGVARSLTKARAEAAKCVLLCANCHAEVEAGIATISEAGGRRTT